MADDDQKDIKEAVEKRVADEAANLPEVEDDDGVTSGFIYDCLQANECGDGALYAVLNNGNFIYNTTAGDWYKWAGHHFAEDTDKKAHSAVGKVVRKYLSAADDLGEAIAKAAGDDDKKDHTARLRARRKLYHDRVRKLRTVPGREKCLTMSHTIEYGTEVEGLNMRGEEFDRRDLLLACSNGVIELDTGKFRDGSPDDYLTRAVPHKWEGIDAKAPIWEESLDGIFDEDKELIAFIQRLAGYGVTGLTTEHIIPILNGDGRNGKSTIVETLGHVLGSLAGPIQTELLLDQKFSRSSTGPSPDIMSLKGLRFAFASEIEEGRRFSTSMAKRLSGGDTLTGRNPHDRYETRFKPTHLLCLLTNQLPHAPGDDFAFWQRIRLVPFNMRFVDNPTAENERTAIKNLPELLRKETAGILAWLVRGCLEYQRQGLNPPKIVLAATEQYRFNEDVLAAFVDECCYVIDDIPPGNTIPIDANDREQYKPLYAAFRNWYVESWGKNPPKKTHFGALLEKRFKKDKVGGGIYFYGINLKEVPQEGSYD